jgi:hypothetical protein
VFDLARYESVIKVPADASPRLKSLVAEHLKWMRRLVEGEALPDDQG